MIAQILHDPLHRSGILPRRIAQQAALAHDPPDADILASVLPGIADADHLAIGGTDPARTLDLQEEELHWSGSPGDLQRAPGKGAILDLGAGVIENEITRCVNTAQRTPPPSLSLGHNGRPGPHQLAPNAHTP